jgi:hypothetical protein
VEDDQLPVHQDISFSSLEFRILSLKGTQSIAGGNAPGMQQTLFDPERVEQRVTMNSLTGVIFGFS